MDFINDNEKKLFKKFLSSSIASALIISIYSFVDSIAIGQYEGAIGTAATAITSTTYGLIVFLAILCGIGGSVMMTATKSNGDETKGNSYFTISTIVMGIIILFIWILLLLFKEQIFIFLGARDTETFTMVMKYAKWMVYFFPCFIYPTFMGAFIRNDGSPKYATMSVIVGGIINIIGDYVFVFPMKLGITGAAIATVLGTVVQCIIVTCYLFIKKCKLRFVKVQDVKKSVFEILSIGFGAGLIDLGVFILGIIINLQISKYDYTGNALAVYGMIATISSLFMAVFSGVGQALQPLVSANYGAKKEERIKKFLRLGTKTTIIIGIVFCLIGCIFPKELIKIFISNVSNSILEIAPFIIRTYFIGFIFIGYSVLSIYYFQSIMRDKLGIIVAILKSFVITPTLLFVLPTIMGLNGIWYAIPFAELVVTVISFLITKKCKIKYIEY